MTTQAWHSLYIPSEDGAAIETAVEQALLQQGYKRYDPFPGGSGLTAHIWRRRVRHFRAPADSGWTRLLGEPDAPCLPLIAAGLGVPILHAWLDESGGDLAVWTPDGPVDDLGWALRGWLRPDRDPDALARALAGDAPVPNVQEDGPQVLAVPLTPDVAELAESVDPAQAQKMMDRLTRQVFGKLGGGKGGDDPQAAAQAMLGQGGAALWNSPAGRRLRAVLACLTIPAGWREPDFDALQGAYQVARARRHNPNGLRLPGDDEALARVPDALNYRPLYGGARQMHSRRAHMGVDDRTRWDEHYRARILRDYPSPDALLVAYAPHPVGKAAGKPYRVALDLAAGQCQNAIWLAEQGYLVNAMDISRIALERGRAEMAMRNLRDINFIVTDLDRVELAEDAYDVLTVFRFLSRPLMPAIAAAIKPGGLIIYQTYNVRRLEQRPDSTRAYLLELGELQSFFPGWEVLHDEEAGDISRLVARRPKGQGV